jgi:hypothetical protein
VLAIYNTLGKRRKEKVETKIENLLPCC